MIRPSHAILAVMLLGCAGCAPDPGHAPQPGCRPETQPAVVVQLLFGRSIRDGGTVDDAAWRGFLASEVTPRFPDGLTVLDGVGQWRNPATGRIAAEASTVVEIVAPEAADLDARLAAVRAAYRRAFAQDSVGLVITQACAGF